MALITLIADKGSPGVTTTATALAAVWPRRVLLAEADPSGGDLVYRSSAAHGGPLDPNTGLLSIAATARRGLAAEQLWDHAQQLSGGLDVLAGLGSSEQAAGLAGQWAMLGASFAALADSPYGAADVIADCGRIGVGSPTLDLLPHADLALLLTRTEPEHLARVRDRAAALAQRLSGSGRGVGVLAHTTVGVLLLADPAESGKLAHQVNEMLLAARTGARVLGVIAQDPSGAAQLAGRKRGRLDKSLLVRSARKVASDLHQQFGAGWSGTPQATAAGR